MEKPAYWRIVHGWLVYIVGYGPRTNGAMPGSESRKPSSSVSAAVDSTAMSMPSGVETLRSPGSPPAIAAASLRQRSAAPSGGAAVGGGPMVV